VEKLFEDLHQQGFRVISDLRNEKVNLKVREHSLQKVPLIGVIGDREVENGTVTVRRFGSKKPSTMKVEELTSMMLEEIGSLALPPGFKSASDE
jgi:threonyl-tRNA synthetase